MAYVMTMNIIIKLGFLAAATILLLNHHYIAGGWCVFGALVSGYSYEGGAK